MLETRGWISLILGLICAALGTIIVLNMLNVMAWSLPTIPGIALYILLIIGGVFVLFDSAHEMQLQTISIIVGILLIVIGGMSIIGSLGVIGFDISQYLVGEIVQSILLLGSGVFLIIGCGD